MINFKKKQRQEPVEPQLATMIDVFSILIIFLVAGSNFENLGVDLPNQFVIPSLSSTSTQNTTAMVVVLNKNELTFEGLKDRPKINISTEKNVELENKNAAFIINKFPDNNEMTLKNKEETNQENNSENIINEKNKTIEKISLIASREVKYDELFSAISQLRKIGFKNINLVGTLASH